MIRNINRTTHSVQQKPWAKSTEEDTLIYLATYDTQSHLNIYIEKNGQSMGICLSPKVALRLRDIINDAYPADFELAVKFKVGDAVTYWGVPVTILGVSGDKVWIRDGKEDRIIEMNYLKGSTK